MTPSTTIAGLIKIEQLKRYAATHKTDYAQASSDFDRYAVWDFIDDAYEGLHVQGEDATQLDIAQYIEGKHTDNVQ